MNSALFATVFSVIGLSAWAQNIHRTACQGNLTKLDSLLGRTSINVQDDRGRSLLHWAVACQKKDVFDLLVQKGVIINGEDNEKKIPMHVAIQFGTETFFDRLLELQRNNEWIDTYGTSLLEQAVLNKDSSSIKKLILSGVDINGVNDRGSSALEISERIGAKDISQFLLKYGADSSLVRTFKMKGKYMGQAEPGSTAKMFAPNFISTEESEFGSVFNARATEFYYGVDVNGKNEIRYSKRLGDTWSKPRTILSHNRYGYNDPFLSNDENRLYFISKQALDGLGELKDVDIWYVQKGLHGWSEPINAGPNVNSDGNEYYMSFTDEGTMYFSSNAHAPQERKQSDYDIFYSRSVDGEFQKPVALGEAINTNGYEADVFIAQDESYIIFCSTRENGFGRGDLYVAFQNTDGTWTPAVNMGDAINTQHYEYCPFVTKDGKFLFYTSNQDIYWISTEIIHAIKEKSWSQGK